MLLELDGTIIFVFISFVVFIFLMNLICYKPIMKIIKERETFIEQSKQKVLTINEEKKQAEKFIEKEISNTKLESSNRLKTAQIENGQYKEDSINSTKAKISSAIEEFENSLNQNSIQAKDKLKEEMTDYVKSIVSKILPLAYNEIKVDNTKIEESLK